MQVRFSADIFRVQRHGGVGRYVTELHTGLLARGVDSQIRAGLHRSATLRGVPQVLGLDVDRVRPARVRQGVTRVVDAVLSRSDARWLPPGAVWHPTYFTDLRPRHALMAVTVHDMIHERYPDEVPVRDHTLRLKRPACEAADIVFVNSHDTGADLIEHYHLDPARVVVTPLGVSVSAPAPGPGPFGDAPYLLYVGDRAPRYKNWAALLDALERTGPRTNLLCFGAPASAADRSELAPRQLAGRVRFEGGDDRQLARAYAGATALIYPSRYEGFGLPPLEAMAQGCPVVATAVGAIPEVVGDAAVLVPPTVEGLTDGIGAVLAGGPAVDRLRSAGRARAASFTWSSTVAATLTGYERITGATSAASPEPGGLGKVGEQVDVVPWHRQDVPVGHGGTGA